jgi:ribosomal protein S18 acetylase RimI-like enzyme
MDIAVRPLTEGDLNWAADVLAATGLSARQPELRRYLALEPAGYYAAEAGGRPVGLGGFVAYERFAFVGNMAVAQDFQGRGVGRAILTRLLEEIDGRGIPETVLEATPEGERLYRKCGFVEAHWTMAYSRVGEKAGPGQAGPAVERFAGSDLDAVAAFDAPRFGTPRRRVLERFLGEFPGRGFVARRPGGHVAGYLIAQSRVLGPWVAGDAAAAESLLIAALALPFDGPAVAYAPAPNGAAAALFARLGFAAHWESLRMRRGPAAPTGRPECIFGLAAPAIG